MFLFNIVGKDIVPCGALKTYDYFDNACSGKNDSGWGCAAWIIKNGNMDYLKCNGLKYDVDKGCS